MVFRFCIMLVLPLLLLSTTAVKAQENDYLKHGKIFCLCSFKKECSECYDCGKQRYKVKIENKLNKQIKHVYYEFYSEVYNKLLEKEAKIQGKIIDPRQTGLFYICVPHGQHWIISKIVYDDGNANTFTLHERFETFIQEPDECDCND